MNEDEGQQQSEEEQQMLAERPPERQPMDLNELARPFDPKRLSWRVGATNAKKNNGVATKGIALAYINARDVSKRLNDVCGAENWQVRYPWSESKRLCCEIGIKINGEWIWKSNGAGDTDVEAEKGAFSDAFKRAAVMWRIGQYLYMLPNTWVEVDKWKKLKETPNLPNWAYPENFK